MTTTTDLKTCHVCSNDLPLDQFRLRRATGSARENRCRGCYAAYMRNYRACKRSRVLQRFSAAVAKESDFHRVSELCAEMFRRFGGVAAFATLWASEVKAAGAKQAGTSRAIKAMLALMHLQAMVQANPPPNPFRELTDSDLREVMQHKLQAALRDNLATGTSVVQY